MLGKPQPKIQHFVKKIETQAKKWFSYKKACIVHEIIAER